MSIHDLTTDCQASVGSMLDGRLQPGRPSNHREATMSTPVVVLAYFRPVPGQRDQVVEGLRPAISAVHQEPGCELYAIHDAPDGTIVMIEKWTSVRELDDHGVGEAVRALNASLEGR